MTALPRFRPVLVHDADREVGMTHCPTEDVLILYAAALPDDEPESEELLDGWTVTTISSHLGACGDCRRQVGALGELTGALRGDRLEEPGETFWDDMAASVMLSIEQPEVERPAAGSADVIPLHRDETLEPVRESADTAQGGVAWWRWAVAAVLVVGVGVAFALATGPRGGDGGVGAVADGGSLVPTADEATALAAELGIDLAPAEPAELFAADVLDVGDAIDEAGWSSLRRDLERMDAVGDLELALVEDDPIEELIELDAEELALLLETLESRT